MSRITFGSLFAGIEGFGAGFEAAGMKCLWQVEIESDCRSVLARHFPGAERFADVREAGRHNLKSVDIICGGFPCQDLSVAGKRAGLSGERSGLFSEMVRITDELRPSFLVWENVPGLLSSDNGRDFARVLISLDSIGYSGAWTGLDAQWFGVAQRRRRIFGVFARGDIGASCCAEILSLGSRLRRNPPTRGKARSGVAFSLAASSGRNSEGNRVGNAWNTTYVPEDWPADVAAPLDTSWADRAPGSTAQEWDSAQGSRFIPAITHALKAEGADASEDGTGRGTPLVVACNNFGERDISTALNTSQERIDGDTETFIVTPFDTTQITSAGNYSQPKAGEPCHPLAAVAYQCQGSNVGEMGTLRRGNGDVTGGVPFVTAFDTYNQTVDEVTQTLRDPNGTFGDALPAVALTEGAHGVTETSVASSLQSNGGKPGQGYQAALTTTGVRRLTPRECERLQGFPDDWTLYGADGEVISDSARYRMLGNAVANPCAEWIARRVLAVMRKELAA